MTELIIAAYNRNYKEWVDKVSPNVKITVYRKGENLNNEEFFIEENLGRDVHTFFYHIVKNYNTLSDFTITSQDYPFDHIHNYVDIINGDITTWSNNAKHFFSKCWFFCTQYPILLCDKMGSPAHPGLDIESVWNELFEEICPTTISFTPSGHFCISKEDIRNRPLNFYKKIIEILETNPKSPWIIERLESYIFNPEYRIKENLL